MWAGDAVSFSTPVADLRHPSGWLTGPLLVCSAGSFVIAFTIGSERSFVLPGIVLGLVVVIAEGAAVINRVRARRRAAQRVVKNLGDLAERGWTLPLVRGWGCAWRFDAREWIDRTGPHGPRLLLREVRLPEIAADPGVTEEDVLATHVERRPLPRKITWFLLAGAVCLSAVGLVNRGPVSVFSLGPLAMARSPSAPQCPWDHLYGVLLTQCVAGADISTRGVSRPTRLCT